MPSSRSISPTIGAGVFIGIALTSTALGTIMPVLRDAGELRTPFGVAATAVGAVGEFGPLLAITLFLSGTTPLHATFVLVGFAIVTGAAIWLAAVGAGRRLHTVIAGTLHTSGQFAVRLVILVLVSLVGLSVTLGIDMLLGAFAAGVLYKLLLAGAPKTSRSTLPTTSSLSTRHDSTPDLHDQQEIGRASGRVGVT